MKFLSFFFLLGLLASAFGGKPSTPRDVHLDSTLVTISDSITPDGIEHVFIEIDRIEDDLTDNGRLLAERDIRVALRFEVDQAQQVLVNGVVAPFGYSELSVEAQIYEVSNEEHIPFGEVVAVMIRVYVGQGEVVLNTGMTVSTLVVQERVVGIQETEVWQAEVVQQIFVVQQDGAAVRFETTKINVLTGEPSDLLPPPPNAMPPQEMPPQGKPPGHHGHHGQGGHHEGGHHGNGHHGQGGHHQGGHHQEGGAGEEPDIAVDPYPGMWVEGGEQEQPPSRHECAMSKKMREFFHLAARWFHGLPFYLRLLVAFAGGVVLGLAGILFVKVLCCLCSGGKKRCCTKGACSQQKGDYKQNIRVYSLQYTAVPQEEEEKKEKKQEKKEEKKEEENAIQMV